MPDDGEDHAEQLPLPYYEEPEAYRARELDFLGRQGRTQVAQRRSRRTLPPLNDAPPLTRRGS